MFLKTRRFLNLYIGLVKKGRYFVYIRMKGTDDKSDKIKLEKKQAHEFISSTIKPTGRINADALSTLLRDPIYNIERAKGFFKDNKGELCTIQYDGLTLEIKKAENEKDPVFVVIGKKNFYNEKEFVERLKSIQT